MSLRSLVAESVRPARHALRSALRARRTVFPAGDCLHLGCGSNLLPGWINVDVDTAGAVDWDLRTPMPAADGSIRLIYSEHFIEHMTREHGLAHLRDCRRLLRTGGILRMSTPNLRHLVRCYLAGDTQAWREQGWSPQTPAQFLNEALHLWGHKFVYDADELEASLRATGFAAVRHCEWGKSLCPDLRDLETRPYHSDLIVEAIA